MRGDTTSSLSKEPGPQHRTGTLKHKLLLWCLNVDYYNGVSWQKEPFNPCWGSGRMQFLVSKEGWMREAGEAERMFKVVKITASSALWNWGKVWIERDFQHHPIPMPWAGTYFSIPGCSKPPNVHPWLPGMRNPELLWTRLCQNPLQCWSGFLCWLWEMKSNSLSRVYFPTSSMCLLFKGFSLVVSELEVNGVKRKTKGSQGSLCPSCRNS